MIERIQRIGVKGLGSLADIVLEPKHLTVLIGSNGSGKSNVLRALQMLAMMGRGSLQRFVADAGGADALMHYGAKKTKAIEVVVDFGYEGEVYRYEAELRFAPMDRLMFEKERIFGVDGVERISQSSRAGLGESALEEAASQDQVVAAFWDWLNAMTFFHFHDTSVNSALRTYARVEDDQRLHTDGGNLAAYLAKLERSQVESEKKAWLRIQQWVRRIAPSVKQLLPTVVPHKNGSAHVRLDWLDDRDERFGVHHFSDGTLRGIALITAFAQPTNSLPRWMSIDEPELGLHPKAIRIVAELARSVSRHTQILFATQSSTFLDLFEPEEIVVVEREKGVSLLKRLDAGDLVGWLEDYSLSEVFQKGVIGGQP